MNKGVKPWFNRAVDAITAPTKQSFIGMLAMQKVQTKVENEKNEIQLEIERLKSVGGDKIFDDYLVNYIVKRRGWTLNTDGTIKEFDYLYQEPRKPLLKKLEHWYVKKSRKSVARKFGEK